VPVRGDPAQLVRVRADHGAKDFAGLVDSGLGRPEQGGLPVGWQCGE